MVAMLGLGLGPAMRGAASAGGPIAPPGGVASIDADGWRAVYPDPPTPDPLGAPELLTVQRPGFLGSGAPTTVSDAVTVMKRVRNPYPEQGTLTADRVSLSDYVYAGDTIAGVPNNSSRPYPKPVACWLRHDRDVSEGATFVARLAVSHAHARAGRPVASVTFIASDGTTSISQTVDSMTSRQWSSGLHAPHFEASLDLSTLAPGLCTLDAIIRPWVGEAFQASVDGSTYPSISFTVLSFLNDRDGSYGAAFAYVDATAGNNATAVVSATAATAVAAPYATIAAAANAIRAFNLAQYGRDDAGGGIIRLQPGVHTHSSYGGAASGQMPLVIEAADPATKASTVYQDASASVNGGAPRMLKIRGITLRKTAGNIVFLDNGSGTASDRMMVFENCTFDQNGQNSYSGWIYKTGRMWLIDCTPIGGVCSSLGSVNKQVNVIGCAGSITGNATYNIVAGDGGGWSAMRIAVGSMPAAEGQMLTHSRLKTGSNGSTVLTVAGANVGPRGFAITGCIFEQFGGTTSPAVSVFADGNTDTVQNIIFMGNTVVGSRINWMYQDSGSVTVAKSGYMRFNVTRWFNIKTDVFGQDGALTGNWPAAFHVSGRGNGFISGANDGSNQPGTGNWLGEALALGDVVGFDPLWADDQSFGAGGAGGGDYTPGLVATLPRIPSGLAPWSVDLAGRAVADDGTARAGAVQPV